MRKTSWHAYTHGDGVTRISTGIGGRKMIAEIQLIDRPQRVAFTPLKQKRRCKFDELPPARTVAAGICALSVGFGHRQPRIRRSGHPHLEWQRVTPPSELLETMPRHSGSPLRARVIDRVKSQRLTNVDWRGMWAALCEFALAFR